MKRPLIALAFAILLITAISYTPTVVYADRNSGTGHIAWIVCELTTDCSGSPVAVSEIEAFDADECVNSIKSSLRAGVAVGKTFARKASVVAGSLALAAHHGATALAREVLGVF